MSPLIEYQAKLGELEAGLGSAWTVRGTTLILLAATILLMVILTWVAMTRRGSMWTGVLPVPAAILLVRRYMRSRSTQSRLIRLQHFYRRGIERMEHRFAGTGCGGEEFRVAHHPYESDLNLFGSGSLFELLCTARTEMGRRRLASFLLNTPDIYESRARQIAVMELAGRSALREEIALLGKFDFRDATAEVFSEWLEGKGGPPPGPALRVVSMASSLLLALVLFYGYFSLGPVMSAWIRLGPLIAGLLVTNSLIGVVYRKRSQGSLAELKRIGLEIGILRDGIGLVQRQRFESPKLQSIQQNLSGEGAEKHLGCLERITNALDDCENPVFELFARLLALRTQLWFAAEKWRSRHREPLKRWIEAWAEFEALVALGGYAHEHPEDSYPEFVEEGSVLDFRSVGHPLLPESVCVRNDFALDPDRRFYIISGSNMAGKSTLLRAVGLNLVLAHAGAPVRAALLRFSPFAICASIAVADSLSEGKSKFLAEIDKLRQALDASRSERPVLFLIDEILSGTNSMDRRVAAEAVLRALIRHGAAGALSTHDLALTEIAEIGELRGCNTHMGSAHSQDPMDFDYLLKPGITSERNALAIARMAGVMSG